MPGGFSGNLIFAIVARMLCGNHLKLFKLIKCDSFSYTCTTSCFIPENGKSLEISELINMDMYTLLSTMSC